MNKPEPHYPVELERIEPEELARLEAEKQSQSGLKAEARVALDQVWREQQDYARNVSGLKSKPARARRALLIAAAILVGAGIIGAIVYTTRPAQEELSEAEALRIASEARLRREEEARAKVAAEAPAETKPAPEPP